MEPPTETLEECFPQKALYDTKRLNYKKYEGPCEASLGVGGDSLGKARFINFTAFFVSPALKTR
jgi:hypothetical protein